MKLKKQLCKLMKNNNYSIIRQKKHYVWGHDYLNCPNIVTSKTPSDSSSQPAKKSYGSDKNLGTKIFSP